MANLNTYIVLENGRYYRGMNPTYIDGKFQKLDISSDKNISDAKSFKYKTAKKYIDKLKERGIVAVTVQPFINTLCYIVHNSFDSIWIEKREYNFNELKKVEFFDDLDFNNDIKEILNGNISKALREYNKEEFIFRNERKMLNFYMNFIEVKKVIKEYKIENMVTKSHKNYEDYLNKMDKADKRNLLIDDLIN